MVRDTLLRRLAGGGFVLALTLFATAPSVAQITTGTILGTVSDTTGGVLPGVTITIRNAGTGAVRTAGTDGEGRYREPQLAIGRYEVQAELQGFQTQVRRNLELTVGSEMVVNFSLGVSTVKETITVTGESPLVQTTSAEVSALVDARMLQTLPLNARDIQQLAVLQPGVQMDYFHNFGKNMVVSGTRPEHNRYLLNGVDTTFTFTTAPVSAAGIIMGIDAVQEFKLLTSDYSAAYGEKAGGVVNTITKSGTNEFHGSGYEFVRDSKFDARNFFDQGDVPPFTRHQFGGSLGGPIVRGKTFFFTNAEQFRQRLHLSNLAIVPGLRARQGHLPDPARPGQEVFVGVAPQVVPYLALFPEPNGRAFPDGTGEFFSNPLQRIDEKYWTIRADHAISTSNSLSGVYTGDWSEEFTPTQNPNFADHRTYNKQIVSVQNVHTFSPTLVNTTRAGFNKSWYFFRTDTTVPVDPSLYFVPNPFYAPTQEGQFGVVNVSGLKGLGQTLTGTTITPRWFDYWMLSLNSDFNWTRGAHAIQFGGAFKRTWDNTVVANPSSRGNFTFLSLRSFLQGQPTTFAVYVPSQSDLPRNWRNNIYGVYVQDDIKVRPNFTVNLGVRYETMVGPTEAQGRITNLRGGLLDPAATTGYPYFKQPRNLFSPRVGLNWDPFGDGKTSVRAGGGIFYDQINNWYYFLLAPGNAPFARNVTLLNPPFPNALAAIPPTSPIDFGAIEYHAKAPTKYAFNLTLQRDIGHRTSVMVAYVGSQSRHLGRGGNQNLFYPQITSDGQYFWPPPPQPRPNANFRSINLITFDANSSYNSFQATVERRVTEGLAFGVNYTFAKCFDDVSNEFGGGVLNGGASLQYVRDRKSSHGPCSFNNVQSANITTTLVLPGRDLQGLAGAIFGGWSWSTITTVQTGVPFDLSLGFHNSRQGDLGAGPDRPGWTPGCDPKSATLGNPNQYFNPSCFVPAAPGFLGNVGSRVLTGPRLFISDWGLVKNVHLPGGQRIEVRAEAFNIFNHANLSVPFVTTLFNADGTRVAAAGRITQTVTPSRQIQFGFKFVF